MVTLTLKERLREAEEYIEHLEEGYAFQQSLLDSFWTGTTPKIASLDHMRLATWGRKRLEEMKKQPALLVKKET